MQGHPWASEKGSPAAPRSYRGALAAAAGSGGGGGGGEEEDDAEVDDLPGSAWLNETGHRRRAATVPWHWRAELAVARGRLDQV
jgi:hypothetical protein